LAAPSSLPTLFCLPIQYPVGQLSDNYVQILK